MSHATDELRLMLDERGVKWDDSERRGAKAVTRFMVSGVRLRFVELREGYCWLDYNEDEPMTPEQVIAVTLGAGTCHVELSTDMEYIKCDKCGYRLPNGTDLSKTRYCGGCGRKVVSE